MATLAVDGMNNARSDSPTRLTPGIGEDTGVSIASSVAFTVVAGENWTFSSSAAWFLAVHATAAVATTGKIPVPAGLTDFVIANGVGSVAMISSDPTAKGNAWKS